MATLEQLVLDGLALNDVTNYRLQGFDAPPPKKRYEWVPGGDADGSALVRDPLFENREIQIRVRVTQRATMDLALTAIAAITAKLEEAEKQPAGLDLVWTPANSTKNVTFKVLSGEVTELPVTMDGDDAGWFKNSPVLLVTLTCKPFGYGTEVVGGSTSSATPFVTATIASVPGDVPAEGRLIITDAATQIRRYAEWGLEQRYYDSGTSLLVDSDNMTVTGYAGAQTTRTGAYDPNATGNNVIRATIWTGNVAVASTGVLAHVGTFRVKARVYSTTVSMHVRLSWQENDGPFRANAFASPAVANAFSEIDLGIITISPKDAGTQRWSGVIEAWADANGNTLDVDYLVLVPAGEGYGKARAVSSAISFSAAGFDDFDTLGVGAALNARVALAGGTWATSGAATDFAGTTTAPGQVFRLTTSDASRRFAILGATSYTDVQVQIVMQSTTYVQSGIKGGVIARWTDANNYVAFQMDGQNATIFMNVAGVATNIATTKFAPQGGLQAYALFMTVYSTGVVIGEIRAGGPDGAPSLTLRGYNSALATGGTLATGKPGFLDQNQGTSAATRVYDMFATYLPGPEPVVINSTRTLEVRSDASIRADSTNTYYGPVPAYRGSRFYVPAAGDENRTSRVLVKAHRSDVETAESANVTDNLTVQVAYTPRYLVAPE